MCEATISPSGFPRKLWMYFEYVFICVYPLHCGAWPYAGHSSSAQFVFVADVAEVAIEVIIDSVAWTVEWL